MQDENLFVLIAADAVFCFHAAVALTSILQLLFLLQLLVSAALLHCLIKQTHS